MSKQKYNQETRLTVSDTLSTDSPEDNNSDKTNKSQHSDIDETSETHQYKTHDEESNLEDIQRRIMTRCDKLQSKILFMKKDTRQRITQSERNKFRECILDTYNDQYVFFAETDDLTIEYCQRKEAIVNLYIKGEVCLFVWLVFLTF